MNQFQKGLRQIKIKDLFSPFIFLFVLPHSLTLKLYNRIHKCPLWIVTERKDTASDNAYWFYKYLKEEHPEINSWYIIDKKCKEYNNVKKLGNIIQYGSYKHWLFYIASDKKISSQKASNPAPALFYILHVYFRLFNNRIYLKHGIIKDNANWWHYDHTRYSKICCGAKAEYDFIRNKFGYPKESVIYTGLARFDNLHANNIKSNQIVVMPTWRNWLGGDNNTRAKKLDIQKTTYYKAWNSLLNSGELAKLAKENNLTILFYPHHNMQKYIKDFKLTDIIRDASRIDIQRLLKESTLLVTDFSSVFMDFAYMHKPMIFYQFDKKEYRERQYQQGYFDYEKNGFGDVIMDEKKLIEKIDFYVKNRYKPETKYIERMKKFFPLHDRMNCERIFEAIK